MIKSGIYKLSWLNDKYFYIGQASDFNTRKKSHLKTMGRNSHCNKRVQRIFNKHGLPDFIVVIDCFKNELNYWEQFYLDWLHGSNGCLNINPTANSPLGTKRTEEEKRKMSLFQKGRTHTQETKDKISAANKGVKRPYAASFWKGKPKSESLKQHLSKLKKGVKLSDEVRKKISEGHKGLKQTTEHVARRMATQDKSKWSNRTIDISTKKVYKSAKDACKDLGLKYKVIIQQLRNKLQNRTSLRYLDKDGNIVQPNFIHSANHKSEIIHEPTGKIYKSIVELSREIGVEPSTINKRLNSTANKWEYSYYKKSNKAILLEQKKLIA